MTTTITRTITAALAGSAATAAIFTGVTLAAPAQAGATAPVAANCTVATTSGQGNMGSTNPLTRAAQVGAIEMAPVQQSTAVSCLGH